MGTPKERCLRVPYGTSSYESLRKDGTAYVDKTRYLEILEKNCSNFLFFVRPRRFGKTLSTTMLQAYYDMCEAENFEQNFRGTYIYDHKTPLQGKYRVLHLDFSGMGSSPDFEKTFIGNLKNALRIFFWEYPVDGSKTPRLLDAEYTSVTAFMADFIALVQPAFGKTLYVLIDECDLFANKILSQECDAFQRVTSRARVVKDFYAALKAATTDLVARVFITGVTTIASEPMISGFEIAENITTDDLTSTMVGFDDDELKELIVKTVDFESFNLDPEQIFRRMKDYYDGYRFSRTTEKSVFNPQMCYHYLQSLANEGEEPESMTDPAFRIDLEKLDGILMGTGSLAFHDDIFGRILYGQKIAFGHLSDNINPNAQNQFSEDDVLSILFYLGLLTYAPDGSGDLVCPNKVVRGLFFNLYFLKLSRGASTGIYANHKKREFSALLTGDAEPLMRYVALRFKSLMGGKDLKHLSARAIETVYLMVLDKSSDFRVKAETEALGEGFCDLLLTPHPEGRAQCSYIIEFKYLPKSNGTAQAVARKLEEAQAQLERYAKVSEIAGPFKKIAAVFVGADLAELSIA